MALDDLIYEHTLAAAEQWLAAGRDGPAPFRPTFAALAALSLPALRRGDKKMGGLYVAMAYRWGGPGGPFPDYSRREADRFLARDPFGVDMGQVLTDLFPDLPPDVRRLLLEDILRGASTACLLGEDAPDAQWVGDLLIRDGSRLMECRGNPHTLVLPDCIRTIDPRALYGCPDLQVLVLPSRLETFSPACVETCTKLTHIFVPPALDPLFFARDGLLYDNHFSLICCPPGRQGTVSVLDGTETIADCAFSHCHRLEEVWLPMGVARIGDYAFFGCLNLPSIHIPETVEEVGSGAFSCCPSLERVYFNGCDTEFQEDTFDEDGRVTVMAMPASPAEELAEELGILGDWDPDLCPC